MITNERQYRITKAQLARLDEASKGFDLNESISRVGSEILAKAEQNALKSEVDVLSDQLNEYEALQSGAVKILKADTLSELPGILIRARIAQGLSQRQLADLMKMKEQQIQRYESEEYASASLRRLSEISDVLKLNIKEIAEIKSLLPTSAGQTKTSTNIDWTRFPIKEMYRRGWFEGFQGSLAAALSDAESLAKDFVTKVIRNPSVAFYRKRARMGSTIDQYSLLAWECRVLFLAKRSTEIKRFSYGDINSEWLSELGKQSRFKDGPIRAKKYLEAEGIHLVIEPHLANTHLDGAVMFHEENPVIGLTLRYDRLDNFWFVLFHEISHIIKHLKKGDIENIFDDLESEPDELEKEADELALQSLIPDSIWETALPRYVQSEMSVVSFAEKLGISPAIVAGRIRNESKNYVMLNPLVGQGEVRRHFPEVNFGV